MRITLWLICAVIAAGLIAAAVHNYRMATNSDTETDTAMHTSADGSEPALREEVTNLDVPWEVVFLPNGVLITERPGTLVHMLEDGTRTSIPTPDATERGEGGLLGMALHPQFAENHLLYLYLTAQNGTALVNRVVRYRFENGELLDPQTIIGNIPGAPYHDGGRIAFGPDGMIYITTGDAGNERSAQDTSSLAGKILRLNEDGSIPADNPFGNAVYSYGHRNPQGLAWDNDGRLWATEHGRSGLASGYDELNLIEAGANYGWPVIQGDETEEGMRTPIIHSGPDTTWAPAGLAHADGTLFWGGLRGEALYEARIEENSAELAETHFENKFGRIRSVAIGPDNALYFTTSNTDGRGSPKRGDDKLIRVAPNTLR